MDDKYFQRTGERLARLETESKQHTALLSKISDTLDRWSVVADRIERIDLRVGTMDDDIRLYSESAKRAREDIWREISRIREEKDREHRTFDRRISTVEAQIGTGKWAVLAVVTAVTLVANFLSNIIF